MRALALAAAAACAAAQQTTLSPPLYVFFSAAHADNVVLATAASIASLDSSYSYIGTNLQVVSNTTQVAGTVPLNSYVNPATKHHITTASSTGNAWAAANGYSFLRVEGYVYPVGSQDESMVPLEMWYSPARGDHFLVGTSDNRNAAVGANYSLQYIDSYVPLQWVQWPNTPPASIPFPRSTDLLGYEYAWGWNAITPNIAADTWYPSWAADGNLYSSFTDGIVDGIHSGSFGARATTGSVTVIGDDPFNLTLFGVGVYNEPAPPYQGRYPSLCFHYNGVWYYGTYSLEDYQKGVSPPPDCGNWCIQGPFTEIRYSLDGAGQNWTAPRRNMTTWTDNLFGESAFNNTKVKMGAPHAVDFGQNNGYSQDGRLYIVGHGAEWSTSHQSWMQGDSVYMARTVGEPHYTTINNASSWEFYAGGVGSGATWAATVADAKPVFVWPNTTGVVTVSYHPVLSKYIMVVSTPTTPPYTIYKFDTYMLEADAITGPWSYVTYMEAFGPEAYFVHWPSKFMGATSYAATQRNAARRQAVPGAPAIVPPHAAARGSGTEGSPLEQAAVALASWERNLTALTAPLADDDAAGNTDGLGGYYNAYLSYSANFVNQGAPSIGYEPNPPGSAYHWCLQDSRLQLSAEFMARLSAKAAMAAASA